MDNNGVRIKRRRYRLNKKKFSIFLFVLTSIIAFIILATGNKGSMASNDMTDPDAMDTEMQTPDIDTEEDGFLIVLDAGHGGFDPGTIGVSGTHEDVLNLAITKRLKAILEQNDMRVIMTREDENALASNKDADMAERSRIIEESRADIVVSIHMNWYEGPEISGPTVLYIPGSVQGKWFAETVQNSMNAALVADEIARAEDFYVLRYGDQPSIMVECGYMSNAEEEAKLQQEDYQQQVAEAIWAGIQKYLQESSTEN